MQWRENRVDNKVSGSMRLCSDKEPRAPLLRAPERASNSTLTHSETSRMADVAGVATERGGHLRRKCSVTADRSLGKV